MLYYNSNMCSTVAYAKWWAKTDTMRILDLSRYSVNQAIAE